MVTSFTDGSKNQLRAGDRGKCHRHGGEIARHVAERRSKDDVMKIGHLYDIEELRRLGGIVDYVVVIHLYEGLLPAEHPGSEAAALPKSL
jgi:hypothetical protein